MILHEDYIIVAGCEPIIRAFNLTDGTIKEFWGHRGWVYCLLLHQGRLFSGGDDNMVRVWNFEKAKQVDILDCHKNGVTSIVMCKNMIVTASYDHYVITWDFNALDKRIWEKKMMRSEDKKSRAIENYYREFGQERRRR